MTQRMSVLHDTDLPEAELCALRLDGDLFGLGTAYCAIDEIETPALRAASLARLAGVRLIVERMTAAWVWGAAERCPTRPQFCSSLDARYRPWSRLPIEHREVAISADEVRMLDGVGVGVGVRVTSPERTLLDLARMPAEAPGITAAMRALVRAAPLGGEHALARVAAAPHLPHSRRAARRMREAMR